MEKEEEVVLVQQDREQQARVHLVQKTTKLAGVLRV
jgi:hypothetical protein